MKKLIYDLLLILIFFTFFSKKIFSQNGIFFSENKGQWHKNVLYKTHFDNVSFYIEKDCFTFDISEKENHHHKKITKKDSIFKKRIKHHSYKVLFENSNPNKKIFAKKLQKSYENFFLGKDKNKWASYVQSYEDVFYENIYKNIDLKVYSQASFLKYDFIINPKGKVSDISFIYKGLYEIRIENDNLILKTSLNEITELKPYSYQIIGKDTFAIKCKFNLDKNKNRLSFIVKNYDKNFPLIIDPILVFSTYSGSGSDNFGFTATFDYLDNVYSGGIVNGDLYPVNLGAYDISYNGSWDIGIIKYDANGTNRLFATYIGGDRNDLPHSLVVNSQNELFIYGSTGSTNFPTTENAFDDSFAGGTAVFSSSIYNEFGTDIYVSRISEDGSELLASTYIGGSLNDGFNTANVLAYNYGDNARGEIIIDKEDDVYLATYTYSDDFPTTTNAFQNSSNGNMEGLVLKLNPNLTDLIWSTYVGGDEDDCIYSIDIDSNNDVFVTGGTRSENFPITYGTYNSNYNGGEADAFIMKFNQNGNLIRSTFFGSEFYDQAYFIKLDANNNVYITGQTKAEGNTLIFNADYSIPNSGQFITKFNPSLTEIIYSTVFGLGDGEPNLSITAFTVDVCNRVYLSSWGREWPSPIYGTQIINGAVHLNVFLGYDWESITGTNGMEITEDAFQNITDGQDFYIMVLSEDASNLEYATYFGEIHYDDCSISGRDHVDGGTSRFDKKGNIYQAVCASCGGCQGFPTTENVWSETNNSSNCNNAVFKFNLEPNIAIADFLIPMSNCPPANMYFENTSMGTSFIWDFGDGSPLSYQENPNHTFTETGIYDVTLISINDESCNVYDTIVKQVEVISPSVNSLDDINICEGENALIGLNYESSFENTTYQWQPTENLENPNNSETFASPEETTEYILFVNDGSCVNQFIQNVNIHTLSLNILEENDTTICAGENLTLTANPNAEVLEYIWSNNENFFPVLNDDFLQDYISQENLYFPTEFYVNAYSEYCETTEIVNVNVSIVKTEISEDTLICMGDTIQLEVNDEFFGENINCNWYCSDNSTIINSNTNNPLVFPTENMTYYVNITNEFDCFENNMVIVQVNDFEIDLTNLENPNCFGSCDGEITIETFPVNSNYTYFSNAVEIPNENINNLCDGENEITVINSFSCSKDTTVIVNEPYEIQVEIIEIINTSCHNPCGCYEFCDGKVILEITGGTPPYNVSATAVGSGIGILSFSQDENNFLNIDTISNNMDFAKANFYSKGEIYILENLCAKKYNINIYDANNCYFTILVEITEPPEIFNIFEKNNVSCFGENDGNISVSTTGGIPPYSYVWNENENLNDTILNNLYAGNYNLQITDSNNCIINENIEIYEPDELILQVPEIELLCYGDSINVLANISGGTEPFELSWYDENSENFFSENNPIFLRNGVYSLFVNDSNNCKDTLEITLTEPDFLEIDLINKSDNHCNGYCIGEAEVMANGGTGDYIYFWNNGFFGNIQNNLCPSTYNVMVIDENNCTNNLFIEIEEDSTLDLQTINFENITCNGLENGSLNLEIFGGAEPLELSWNHEELPNSLNLNNLDAGIYNLTIMDNDGCFAFESITITEPEILNVEIEILQEISCFNGIASIEANVTGGTPPYEYFWNNLEDTTNIVNDLSAGTYSVNITDANNCEIFKEFEILQPEILSINIENLEHNICFGDSLGFINLEVFGGTPEYNFLWSNGDTTIFTDSLNAGIYSVIVYDNNNCKDSLIIEIESPNQLIFNNITTNNISCYGENDGSISVNLNGGILPYNYFLNEIDFQDENLFENLYAGTYNLEVFDANNCKISHEIFLDEPELLNVEEIENIQLDCFGDSISINFYVSGGTPEYNYFLDTLSNQIETNIINNLSAGSYEIIVIDENQCQTYTKFEITQADSFFVQDSIFNNPCFGDNLGSINLEVFGGNPEYNFLWNNGNTTNSINGLYANTYNCLITDMNNCEINYSMEILQMPEIVLNFSKRDMRCFGINDAYINIFASGGTEIFDYNWANNISYSNLADNLSDGIYNVEVTDENACQKSLEIEILPSPEIMNTSFHQLGNILILCSDDFTRVNLTTTGGVPPYTYFWSNSSNTNNFAENLHGGVYDVIITDKNNCKEYLSFPIYSPEPLVLDGEIKEATCKSACNGKLNLKVSGGTKPYSYFLEEVSIDKIIENLCIGEYEISVRDANNCEIQDSFKINFLEDTLKLNIFSDRDTIYKGESLQLNSEIKGLFKYILWDNIETLNSYEIPHPIAKPVKNTLYTATLIDLDGCGYQDKLEIFVKDLKCDEPFIFVPNAFSPNDDGKNDILYVQSDVVEEIYFAIYNRWGNLLFETNDIKKGWDGKFKGEKVEPSVLVYYIKVKCLNKEIFSKKGNITVIR